MAGAGLMLALAALQVAPAAAPPPPGLLRAPGYLEATQLPDSLTLVPPPPAPGSAALVRDAAAAKDALAQRGTARWAQAARDADLSSPAIFSCVAGHTIGAATTPRTVGLLMRALPDLGRAVYPTKRRYMRPRPFMTNGAPTCTPQAEAALRRDGAYPSGHSAIGYGWGLLLAELVPERATALAARGRDFGDSRRICNVHWLSDVEEGRIVAAAVVARLHADTAFRADLDAARGELAGAPPARGCGE